jgi:hypothetical protein
MIATLKQYGTNYARRTVRRQLINYAIGGALVITGGAYYLITGKPYPGAESSEPEPAPVVHHPHVPKSPAAKPAAATAAAATPAAAAAPGAPITAQGIDINAPKRAALKAVAAENAQLAAQTGQDVPAAQPLSGPGSVPSGALPALSTARPIDHANDNAVTREVYRYGGIGRRDPFYSLILTDDLRPLIGDLKLVGILYEPSGRRTVAVMRDLQTNAQYRVQNGQSLGRMRVTQIRPRAVLFTIEEFGLSRQDSLVWTDTLKVRN